MRRRLFGRPMFSIFYLLPILNFFKWMTSIALSTIFSTAKSSFPYNRPGTLCFRRLVESCLFIWKYGRVGGRGRSRLFLSRVCRVIIMSLDRDRISFQALLPSLPGMIDLILYMAQQYPWYFILLIGMWYPSLPSELGNSISTVYSSKREYSHCFTCNVVKCLQKGRYNSVMLCPLLWMIWIILISWFQSVCISIYE